MNEFYYHKRPAEEFCAMNKDAGQLRYFYKTAQHAKAKPHLAGRLMEVLKQKIVASHTFASGTPSGQAEAQSMQLGNRSEIQW